MVLYNLFVQADLENVSELKPTPDMRWYLKFKCGNCNEVTERWNYVTSNEQLDNPHGRGKTNFILHCKFCKREHTVDVVTKNCKEITQSSEWTKVVAFECRGVIPIAFDLRGGWSCKAVKSGKEFEVDLSEDWVEYDDESQESLGIYNVKYKLEKD
jgi:hypothetical protein